MLRYRTRTPKYRTGTVCSPRNKELALLANEQAAPPLQAPVAPGEADIVVMPPAAELAETNLFISMCQIIIFNLF